MSERNESICKPLCWRNRRAIALLAAGSLPAEEAQNLESHIETCSGCRQYWKELTQITAGLAKENLRIEVQPSAAFHRNLMQRLLREPANVSRQWRVSETFASFLEWRWQIAATAFAVIGILVAILFLAVSHRGSGSGSREPLSYAGLNSVNQPPGEISPTLASYEAAANQSLEQLDALLTRHANQSRASLPVYRASALTVSAGE